MEISHDRAVAIRRWKLGHHVFHLHLAMMNTHLIALRAALDSENWPECLGQLELLARLYRGATASMRYASDFPPAAYGQLLRPAMEPPWVSPGFSGKFNADHERMLDLLKSVRGPLKQAVRNGRASDDVGEAARQLWREQSRNRAQHKLICEKFVPGGKSLLQEYFADANN
jgi:hypothetical protein